MKKIFNISAFAIFEMLAIYILVGMFFGYAGFLGTLTYYLLFHHIYLMFELLSIYILVGIFFTYVGFLGERIKESGRAKRLIIISIFFYPILYLILLFDYIVYPEQRGYNFFISDSNEVSKDTVITFSSDQLSKSEEKELKELYRKASKLCHPDIVPPEQKKEAEDIFKELNHYYSNKNIFQVRKILLKLKSRDILGT